ncbi:hypothetical protein TrVE_jg10044 [Triparma verrucosa]|uniref:Bromo domain-containing protein n=1 Tax=Triparma verrucosa TaxID=1606542 RepID=A0A9W6ZBU2_9STRA|nr:hypothetical protein TrVE_jg10044 [Triparma verrucosa]
MSLPPPPSSLRSTLQSYLTTISSRTEPNVARYNYLFHEPVNLTFFPTYPQHVSNPIDFTTIGSNIAAGHYDMNAAKFWSHLELCFSNCKKFNARPDNDAKVKDRKWIDTCANQMERKRVSLMKDFTAKERKAREALKSPPRPRQTPSSGSLNLTGSSRSLSPAANRSSSPNPSSSSFSSNSGMSSRYTSKHPKEYSPNSWTPLPWSPSTRRMCLDFFSLLNRCKPPYWTTNPILKKSHKSRPLYKLRVGSTFPDGLKEIEAKVRLTGSEGEWSKSKLSLQPNKKGVLLNQYVSAFDEAPDDRYKYLHEFVSDVRRAFGNRLSVCDGTQTTDWSERTLCIKMLEETESFLSLACGGAGNYYPELCFDWQTCLRVLEGAVKTGLCTWFLYPVTSYFNGEYPQGYLDIVKCPMDFLSITNMVVTSEIKSRFVLKEKVELVFNNCRKYYDKRQGGEQYRVLADKMLSWLNPQGGQPKPVQLFHKLSVAEMKHGRVKYGNVGDWGSYRLKKVPMKYLVESFKTDTFWKDGIQHTTSQPFETLESVKSWDNYKAVIPQPISLKCVIGRISRDYYKRVEDFEYEICSIFDNCVKYWMLQPFNAHSSLMVKFGEQGLKAFRKLYNVYMKKIRDRNEEAIEPLNDKFYHLGEEARRNARGRLNMQMQMVKREQEGAASQGGGGRDENVQVQQYEEVRSMRDIAEEIAKKYRMRGGKVLWSFETGKANDAHDVHLLDWEKDCKRWFKALLKHDWLNPAKTEKKIPLFFNVPVTKIWTSKEFSDYYFSKVKRPMDLTTCECKLRQGSFYTCTGDFLDDILLVFSNCCDANKEGYDSNETNAIAYYDAGEHMLKFIRQSAHDYFLSGGNSRWDLSPEGRDRNRKEMDGTFLNPAPWSCAWVVTPIPETQQQKKHNELKEWGERRIRAVLQVLKSNKYQKHFKPFYEPMYPLGYDNVIAKRSDFTIIKNNLEARKYKNFHEVVGDLRLMFSNAIQYNLPTINIDPYSKIFHDAALFMQPVLEEQIDKLRLQAVERIGKTKVENDYVLNVKFDKEKDQIKAIETKKEEADKAQANVQAARLEKIENWDRAKAGEGDIGKERLEKIKQEEMEKLKKQKALELLRQRELDEKAAAEAAKLAEERGIQVQIDRQTLLRQAEEDMILGNPDEAEIEERERAEEEEVEKEKGQRQMRFEKREEEFDKKIKAEMAKATEELNKIMMKRGRREGDVGVGKVLLKIEKEKKRKREAKKLEVWAIGDETDDEEDDAMAIDF